MADKQSLSQKLTAAVQLVSLSLIAPALLLWPIFRYKYILDGPASPEIRMIAGLKEVFNQFLLQLQFPLWNEFVETGAPFVLFGSTPLSFLTPLEMLLSDLTKSRNIAVLIFASLFFCSLSVIWICDRFKLARWFAVLALVLYFLFEPIQLLSHFTFVHSPVIVALPGLVFLLAAYLDQPRWSLVYAYWLLSLVFSVGGKPEMFLMFILFSSAVILTHGLVTKEKAFFVQFIRRLFLFEAVPLLLFAWQIPLIKSLMAASSHRFFPSQESLPGSLYSFLLSIGLSQSLRVGLIIAITALVFNRIPKLHTERFRGLTLAGLAGTGLLCFFTSGFVDVRAWCIFVGAILFLAWNNQQKAPWLAMGLLSGALFSIFCETMELATGQASSTILIHLGLGPLAPLANVGLMFILFLGAFSARPLSRTLFLFCIVGWILREFLTAPLFDFTNFLYANPRDIYFYAAIPLWFFVLGFNVLFDRSSPRWTARSLARTLVGGALACFISYGGLVSLRVPPGSGTTNSTWLRPNGSEGPERLHLNETMVSKFKEIVSLSGGFARSLTMESNLLSLAGHLAGRGVTEAWGYAFVNDSWLKLANLAFHRPEFTFPFPRPYAYTISLRRVYDFKNHELKTLNLWEQYGHIIYPKTAAYPDVNVFSLELMRVGVLWRTADSPLNPAEGIELAQTDGQLLTYRLIPKKALSRFGFVPGTSKDWQSEVTSELMSAYDQVVFSQDGLTNLGVEIKVQELSPNQQVFEVTSPGPGHLLIFDNWHPDWRATRNGARVDIAKVFMSYRAIEVLPGKNEFIFQFRPKHLMSFVFLSLATLVGILTFALLRTRERRFNG